MAVTIKSSISTDEMIVDPISKAARVTEYLKGEDRAAWPDNHPTFSVFNASFTIPATPTDIITFAGSASKTVAITRMWLGTLQTTSGVNYWNLVKRSSVNTGGVAVIGNIVPHDSLDVATAEFKHYTTLPTPLGTSVGNAWAGRISSPALATAGIGAFSGVQLDCTREYGKPIVLRGVSQLLAWNFLAQALPAGMTVIAGFTWFEY